MDQADLDKARERAALFAREALRKHKAQWQPQELPPVVIEAEDNGEYRTAKSEQPSGTERPI